MSKVINEQNRFRKIMPWLLALCGIIGFFASFILTVEKIELIKDPSFIPSCNLSPIVSCGSVMKTPQAEAFGFTNSLMGIGGFAIVATIGMALLAGARFKRWFWLGLGAGALFGVVFIHWLFSQSVYVIGALCPYCMVVWAVTIPIFWYTTLYNLREGHIKLPHALHGVVSVLQKYHVTVLYLWYLAIIIAILIQFWSYWSSLI